MTSALPEERLRELLEKARCDDWHTTLVGSDIRELIAEIARLRASTVSQKRLLEHIWLHITSDENFDADELKRDIERSGEIDELRGLMTENEVLRSQAAALASYVREQCAQYVKAQGNKVFANMVMNENWVSIAAKFHEAFQAMAAEIRALPLPTSSPLREAVQGLVGAVQRIEPNIGWRGRGEQDRDNFYCEFCGASHEDCTKIPHHDECIVYLLKVALSHPALAAFGTQEGKDE